MNQQLDDQIFIPLRSALVELQKNLALKKDALKKKDQSHDSILDDISLGMIDILDLLQSKDLAELDLKTANLLIKKAKKRLERILTQMNVGTIEVPRSIQSEDAKYIKVVDSKPHPEYSKGEVISVIRSGYERKTKVLREAEVVTSLGYENQ